MLVLLLGLWIGVSIGLLLGASWASWRLDRRDLAADEPRCAGGHGWNSCAVCGRSGPAPFPIDAQGAHEAPLTGAPCHGLITSTTLDVRHLRLQLSRNFEGPGARDA